MRCLVVSLALVAMAVVCRAGEAYSNAMDLQHNCANNPVNATPRYTPRDSSSSDTFQCEVTFEAWYLNAVGSQSTSFNGSLSFTYDSASLPPGATVRSVTSNTTPSTVAWNQPDGSTDCGVDVTAMYTIEFENRIYITFTAHASLFIDSGLFSYNACSVRFGIPKTNAVRVTTNLPPQNVSVSGLPTTLTTGTYANVTATWRDPDGYGQIFPSHLLIRHGVDGSNACYLKFFQNSVWLLNAAGTDWGGVGTLGSTGFLDNAWCRIALSGSSTSGSGTDRIATVQVMFYPTMGIYGTLSAYLFAYDYWSNSGWSGPMASTALISPTVASPTFTPSGGSYSGPQTVSISTTPGDAIIRYTTDGSTPTPTSGTAYKEPIAVNGSTTIRAIGYKAGWTNSGVASATYTLPVSTPTISPASGTFGSPFYVTLTTATPGASIRYTTNGSAPSPSSGTVYGSPFWIGSSGTVKAIAYLAGWNDSPVASAAYTFQVAPVSFTPPAGTYNTAQMVSISSGTPGAAIRYTTDGSDPTPTTGNWYWTPVAVTAGMQLKAIAYYSNWNSATGSASYTLSTATPSFNPPAGSYSSAQTVAITSATPESSIRYTMNGETPTCSSGLVYTGPVIANSTITLRAVACRPGFTDSAMTSADYAINASTQVLVTEYSYTAFDQLASVTMVRDTGTQTRTFNWSGSDLLSATNPENGTVTYTYDSAHRVTSRIDAKGQKTAYAYDLYGRLASRRYYIPVNGEFEEQTDQAVTYHYDTNPFATTSNAWGRLAAVTFGNGFRYDYSYNQAGRVTSRNLHARTAYVISQPYCCTTEERFFDFSMAYQWDNEGRMTSMQYPAVAGGATYNYGFDDMGRLSSMTQGENSVATATYGVAGELTTLWTANFGTETHTYNSMFQLTRIRALDPPGAAVDLEYRYPAGQNNGRITQAVDWATGEEVTYTYDALQRLTKAETTGPQWGQAYSYDGFGNLTGKTVTKGSATTLSLAIDAATNRPGGVNYDANGNAPIGMWDVENRLVMRAADGAPITYDPSNQRVMQYKVEPNSLGDYPTWTVSLYGLGGERAGDVKCVRFDNNNYLCNGTAEPTFGGRRLAVVDRLGSTRAGRPLGNWTRWSYYPYGEEKDPGGAEGTVRFGTYVRDSMGAGVDYANQRYYSPLMGRFFSPDPGGLGTANAADPGSWNRYAYAYSDPANYIDPDGLFG